MIEVPKISVELPADRLFDFIDTGRGKMVVVVNFDALALLVELTWDDHVFEEGERQIGGANWVGQKHTALGDPIETMADIWSKKLPFSGLDLRYEWYIKTFLYPIQASPR